MTRISDKAREKKQRHKMALDNEQTCKGTKDGKMQSGKDLNTEELDRESLKCNLSTSVAEEV